MKSMPRVIEQSESSHCPEIAWFSKTEYAKSLNIRGPLIYLQHVVMCSLCKTRHPTGMANMRDQELTKNICRDESWKAATFRDGPKKRRIMRVT